MLLLQLLCYALRHHPTRHHATRSCEGIMSLRNQERTSKDPSMTPKINSGVTCGSVPILNLAF
jgi:hypothetical protein